MSLRSVGSGTRSFPWMSIGTIDATAAGADVALAVTERDLTTNKALDNVVYYEVPEAVSALKVRFRLTTNNADVDIDIWTGTVAKPLKTHPTENCSLQRRATLDVICGDQNHHSSGKFADTCNVSNDSFENGIDKANPGADHMEAIHFDLKGENIVLFHGYGTFDEDCIIEVKGYS